MTDFNMPIMDGIAASRKIRDFLTNTIGLERINQPKIVGVTGHVHDQFKIDGLQAGMDEIVEKPCYLVVVNELLKSSKVI